MEVCSEWEIYIPTEAEVKNIPLKSLPKSVVRRIGLPLSDIDSSRKPDSSDVIWICPAVIGRKGQGSASHKERDLAENAFLASDFQGGPLKMSFVSSNRTARDVLKNISAGKHSSNKEHLCQDSMQLANHNAVVVYKGQIYLCIRKARRGQQMTPELKSPTHAAIPSTSGLPSASFTKELIRGKRKIKADAGKVKHCEKADELKRKNDSAVRAENSAPRPPHSRHRAESKSQGNKAARKEFSEEPLRSSCTQPQENQKDPTNRVSREYEVNNLGEEEDTCTNDLDCNQMDCQEDECNGSDGQMEPLGSTAQRDCDFNDLKQEEMIAHLKAKFMQDEAALSDLIRTAH